MKIQTEVVEVIGHEEITQIKLINDAGVEVDILTLGATWQSLLVPQLDGAMKNIVLGHERPSDYNINGICAGQSIGRVAGRINHGEIEINNQVYQLDKNNNGHCLHGGLKGAHRQNWHYQTFNHGNEVGVTLSYRAKQSEDKFPGDVTISVTYLWDNRQCLTVQYQANDSTQTTLFNPTNHVYFNLGDSEDLSHHSLWIDADYYLQTTDELIPTGQMLAVDDTPYDFRQAKNVMKAIKATGGIDNAFVVDSNSAIAKLVDEQSGDAVEIYSQRNGLVVYSFNFPEDNVYFSRSQGRMNVIHEGLALEAQILPDAINHNHFGDITVQPQQSVTHTIQYQFDFKSLK